MRAIPPRYVEPFLPSANRRHLMAGMEFPAFLFSLWAPCMTAILGANRYAVIAAIVLWLMLTRLFRAMARRDPFMTEIYMNSLRYQQQDGSLEFPATPVFAIRTGPKKEEKKKKRDQK